MSRVVPVGRGMPSGVFGAPNIGELRYATVGKYLVFYRVEDVREMTDKEAQALMQIFGGAPQTIIAAPVAPPTRPARELPADLLGKRKLSLDHHRNGEHAGRKEQGEKDS